MDNEKNYYDILGITDKEKALKGEEFKKAVKKRYYKLSKEYHPDMQNDKSETEKNEAAEKFKDINEAYDVLSDDEKREHYDNPMAPPSIEDFWFRREGPQKGRNIRINVEVSMVDCIYGATKRISYTKPTKCKRCNGSGIDLTKKAEVCPSCNGTGGQKFRQGFSQMFISCNHCGGSGRIHKPCPECGGQGFVPKKEEVTLDIPKGVDEGDSAEFVGMGHESHNGGPNGDLYIVYVIENASVKDGRVFERCGKDLSTPLTVDYLDLLTGCKKEITLIDGKKIEISVKECCKPGSSLRISGKGLPRRDGSDGDLYCVVNVEMPKSISEGAAETIGKLKEQFKNAI